MTLKGVDGSIAWAWHQAALLGAWTITAHGAGGNLTAAVKSSDDYRLGQPNLKFCVVRPSGVRWIWPVLSHHIAGGTLHASLGPQE